MVQTALEENPFSGHVFVFRGRRGDLIKVLWFDGDGLCLFLAYRSPLVCTNHGSMANALPQAIGAQVSHPARQVISLSGDGGIAMLLGDLLSLRQLQLPVK